MSKLKKHAGGRPNKLDAFVIKAIIDGIRQGLTIKEICKTAGVTYSTYALWIVRGNEAKQNGEHNRYTALVDLVKRAYRDLQSQKYTKIYSSASRNKHTILYDLLDKWTKIEETLKKYANEKLRMKE